VWLSLRRERGHATLRSIVRQSLESLATLHARNVTHRDLKPPNLLLQLQPAAGGAEAGGVGAAAAAPAATSSAPSASSASTASSGGAPVVRLADFGSGIDAEVTRPHVGMYPLPGPSVEEETEGYQPPEAALGGAPYAPLHPSTYDLWSMGITVLELLLATPDVLPLSRRAEAVLRLKYASQPPPVMRRLLIANALAEHCILPAAAAADPAAVARYGRKGTACGKAEFIEKVLQSDPLSRAGGALSLAEAPRLLELVDLAWHLLRWRPQDRLSATQALRHPAFLERPAGTERAEPAGGNRPWWDWKALLEHPRLSAPIAAAAA